MKLAALVAAVAALLVLAIQECTSSGRMNE